MPDDAPFAVLFGALLHAGLNAAIKSGRDTFLDTVLVATGAGGSGRWHERPRAARQAWPPR